MSAIDPAAVWQGLQEVHDGADPADIYARIVSDSVDPLEAIENDYQDCYEEAHDFPECLHKTVMTHFCHGFTCVPIPGGNMMTDCPCKCHKEEL
ncbi:hypothetical protein [Arthrobacter sp. UYCu723]